MKTIQISLTIGELAKSEQINIQTIRYYEREGLLKPHKRLLSGYRLYDLESQKRLKFILEAKKLGFSLDEIKELLNLRIKSIDHCDRVRTKAKQKLEDIQNKIKNLKSLENKLKRLVSDCSNRKVSDCCPIINRMES